MNTIHHATLELEAIAEYPADQEKTPFKPGRFTQSLVELETS